MAQIALGILVWDRDKTDREAPSNDTSVTSCQVFQTE